MLLVSLSFPVEGGEEHIILPSLLALCSNSFTKQDVEFAGNNLRVKLRKWGRGGSFVFYDTSIENKREESVFSIFGGRSVIMLEFEERGSLKHLRVSPAPSAMTPVYLSDFLSM